MSCTTMHIRLDLSAHCIETELKRLYHASLAAYFKADEGAKLQIEQTIEAVTYLLETMDFPHLRATYPPLAGHTDISIALSVSEAPPAIMLGDAPIRLVTKNSF